MTTRLRPLGVGEILDAGIKVVTRHWKPLAGIVAILTGPVFIVYALVLASIDSELLSINGTFSTSSSSSTTAGEADATALVGLGISYLVLFLAFLLAFVACFKAVSDAWLGAQPSVSRSLRFAVRRSFSTAILGIIASFAVMIGLVLCVVPGIWLGIAWSVCLPALLFERVGAFKALSRSFSLIKGRWWGAFLLWLVGYLLVSIIGGIVQLGLVGVADAASGKNTIALAIATVVGSTASSAITYPYLAAVLTILYFDQRVRKEGFDLQLQARGLGAEHDPEAPLPEPLVGEDVYTPEQRAAAPYWPPPPGWTPPPPVEPWSSQSGWSAPSPASSASAAPGDPLWSGADAVPTEPLPPHAERDEEPPPTYPGWSGPPPEQHEGDDKPDRRRADWLPPEAPRGPGGL